MAKPIEMPRKYVLLGMQIGAIGATWPIRLTLTVCGGDAVFLSNYCDHSCCYCYYYYTAAAAANTTTTVTITKFRFKDCGMVYRSALAA